MADSVEQLYKAQDLQEKLYPITKENAVKDNSNVSLDTKLTSINTSISNKVDKVTGKGLSTNDYTSAEKTKLAGIEAGAQVNIIESIELNGESQPIENKTAKIDIDIDYESKVAGSAYSLMSDSSEDYSFNYRQVPSGIPDGSAKMNSIYGKTLVWNQLVKNGNFADGTNNWTAGGSSNISASNGELTVTVGGAWNNDARQNLSLVIGHKYLGTFKVKSDTLTNIGVAFGQFGAVTNARFATTDALSPTYQTVTGIATITESTSIIRCSLTTNGSEYVGQTYTIKDVMLFDLTQMFGSGNEPSTIEEFTSLFPKPYYDYCKGVMLSFGGRNVKFNQMVQNGNFESTSGWSKSSASTFSVSNNVATFLATGQYQNIVCDLPMQVVGHKYLMKYDVKFDTALSASDQYEMAWNNGTREMRARPTVLTANTWQTVMVINESVNVGTASKLYMYDNRASGWSNVQLKNIQIFDLTEMFGVGNEPSASGFKELFPNDYYEYNVGQYMNIGQPVSLKTVGKNLVFKTIPSSTISGGGAIISTSNFQMSVARVLKGKEYVITTNDRSKKVLGFFYEEPVVGSVSYNAERVDDSSSYTFTSPITGYVAFRSLSGYSTPMLEFGSVATDYEPYTSSTLSLPISTYFPNGMKSTGTVYDELTPTKAITRIGAVDLGSLGWRRNPNVNGAFNCRVADMKLGVYGQLSSVICPLYETVNTKYYGQMSAMQNMQIAQSNATQGELYLINTSYNDVTAFKTAMTGVYLYYELATPLENYGIVDLGSLNWSRRNDVNGAFFTKIDDMALGVANKLSNLLCPLYATRNTAYYGQLSSFVNMEIAQGNATQGEVYLVNTSYNDVATFKQAMSGVYLLYEKENPTEVKSDLSYKVFENGTEQLLPINSSVPVTTPLNTNITYPYVPEENVLEAVKINNTALPITDKAVNITIDSAISETSTNAVQNKTIKSYVDTAKEEVKEDLSNSVLENLTSGSSLKLYAQETLEDQEFLYRESPTEEDGLAKITDIKGNTLVWNQLVQNGNFENTSGWSAVRGTISASSNVLSYTVDVLGGGGLQNRILRSVPIPAGHKVYISMSIKATKPFALLVDANGEFYFKNPITANGWNLCQTIKTISTGMETLTFGCPSTIGDMAVGDVIQFKDVMLVDLTKMGLDYITDPSDFTSLFSLPYYAYNQGTLLSFNGNGIKAVGKNRLNYDEWKTVATRNGTSVWENNGVTITATSNDAYTLYGASTFPVNARIPVREGETITLSWESDENLNGDVCIFPNGGSSGIVFINNRLGKSLSYTPAEGVEYVTIRFGVASTGNTIHFKNIMVRFADTDDTYVLYTSSTLSLPISTYFPTGMKDVASGTCDILSSQAIQKIAEVDMGDLKWQAASPSGISYTSALVQTIFKSQDIHNQIKCSCYNERNVNASASLNNKEISVDNSGYVQFKDESLANKTSSEISQALTGQKLYYELATPTETSFTTASLVTENTEMRYPVYAGGTEQILPENSSIPTTAPIVADIEYSYDFKAVDRIIGMLNSVAQNETSPSTHNYSVGDYLVYKYQLYKVIASISTGASLTVGTNIQATTIMNELASLS